MKVGDDNFVVLQGWMLNDEYDLSAKELIALGLINGFSQDGESKYQGNLAYIQEWIRADAKNTAKKALESLEKKGLIAKEVDCVNGVYFNRYKVIIKRESKIDRGGQKLTGGVSKIDPNNNIYNNISTTITPPNNNSLDNINISEDENLICTWLKDDIDIRQLQFKRLGLIESLEEFEMVLKDQVSKFYEQCRLDGKGDIRMRGRIDVISHFNNWIKVTVRKEKDDAADRKGNERTEEGFLSMLGC